MRFKESDYLKAFPRENKKPVHVVVDEPEKGSVTEEADQMENHEPQPDPDSLPSEDPEGGEGDGNE